MNVQALRGVCIGVERHLLPGDVVDLDPATARYLEAIGAVTTSVTAPAVQEPDATKPGKPGKKD